MATAIIITVIGGLLAVKIWRAVIRSGLIQFLWHFWTGLELDRQPRTRRWSRRRHAQVRALSVAAIFGLLYGLIAAYTITIWAATTALFALAIFGGWRLWQRKLRHLPMRWRYARPLGWRLAPVLEGLPPRLQIEPDRTTKIWLPAEFIGTTREWEQLDTIVGTTLGLEAPERDRQLQGTSRYVTYRPSEPPPANVALPDIRTQLAKAAEHEIVMGLGVKAQVTTISVDNDSPHVGLSMGSGEGKSTVAKNMAAQILYHGGLVMVLDYKLISHMWARGLPNVSYAGTPAEIEAAMVWLAAEVTRRNQLALAHADVEGIVHANPGPRIFVICEELNATQNRLKAWWNREMGEKGRSPGSEALDEVMFLGRQVCVNVLQIGQRLSVKATGSGDARENLGVLIFADPTASAWKMLVGDRHALPPASGHRGRLQVVTKKTVHATQGAFLTGAQARDLATAGKVATPPIGMPGITIPVRVPAVVGQTAPDAIDAPDLRFVAGQTLDVTPSPSVVTLAEAVEAGMWPTQAAARKAVQRAQLDDAGYRGAAKLYTIEALATARRRKADR